MNSFLRSSGRRLAMLAGTTTLAVALAGLAVPASASTSGHPARRSCTPSNAWVSIMNVGSSGWIFCSVGTKVVAGTGPFVEMSSIVFNRIWLHQNPNGSGWADCFEGRLSWPLHGRDQNPGNVQVSANTNPCP